MSYGIRIEERGMAGIKPRVIASEGLTVTDVGAFTAAARKVSSGVDAANRAEAGALPSA